jgi:hypothetical protein
MGKLKSVVGAQDLKISDKEECKSFDVPSSINEPSSLMRTRFEMSRKGSTAPSFEEIPNEVLNYILSFGCLQDYTSISLVQHRWSRSVRVLLQRTSKFISSGSCASGHVLNRSLRSAFRCLPCLRILNLRKYAFKATVQLLFAHFNSPLVSRI